jgi:hypothetical protein
MTPDPVVAALAERARLLYEGKAVAHRSCGIALAETFGRPTAPYQALRRGGVTGAGTCGAIVAGQLLLGELLGDPDPTGPVTPALRDAMARYFAEVAAELGAPPGEAWSCNALVSPFPIFQSEERAASCTRSVVIVARIVARIAVDHGVPLAVPPPPSR